MRMLELYKFEELSSDVQETVIEYHRDILIVNGDWEQQVSEQELKHVGRLEEIGFNHVNICTCLNEGAYFTTQQINVESVLKHYGEFERFQPAITGYVAAIEKCPNVNETLESSVFLNEIGHSTNKLVPALSAFIMDMARMEMRKIFRELKASYNNCRSDQAVYQALIECPCEYTIDGEPVEIG